MLCLWNLMLHVSQDQLWHIDTKYERKIDILDFCKCKKQELDTTDNNTALGELFRMIHWRK